MLLPPAPLLLAPAPLLLSPLLQLLLSCRPPYEFQAVPHRLHLHRPDQRPRGLRRHYSYIKPYATLFRVHLAHITVMLYPGVSVPIVFDTGSGVTTDASADSSSIPGRLTKVAVLRTRHIITMDGVSSPLLLTFGIGSDVSVNACLGIATIEALCLLFDPVQKTVYNDVIGQLLQCPSRRPDPVLVLPPSNFPFCPQPSYSSC